MGEIVGKRVLTRQMRRRAGTYYTFKKRDAHYCVREFKILSSGLCQREVLMANTNAL